MRTHKKVVKARNNSNGNVEVLQERLFALNEFETALSCKPIAEDVEKIAQELGITPKVLTAAKQQPKSERVPRLPYRVYTSSDGIEIYVGKQAEDNDELSTSSKHRKKNEWWLHASGCPGSHVVVKSSDEHPSTEAVQDAAALAARHSKFARAKTVKVSLTRCRDVLKRAGSPPGQVVLTGTIKVISVNMHAVEERLVRLDSTRSG
jgi:predicted ribosome quality control (RQC) complex YloA/Tae2 family protein